MGGSIAIHAFGAYFGLGASWALRSRKTKSDTPAATPTVDLNGPSYNSDVTAMIGKVE